VKHFLAIYLGSPENPGKKPVIDKATQAAGMQAWIAWGERYAAAIVDQGTPIGRTKRVDAQGVSDTRNLIAAYAIVQAESHEAAAKMFEGHPHFAIFPGDAVEVMECLPMPELE
jgi:hypothetical protein